MTEHSSPIAQSAAQTITPDADILILGAGPAGLICALTAARRAKAAKLRREILLVDQDRTPARKLKASGGGRSNCTNLNAAPAHYLSKNPRFTAQALKRYTPAQFLALLQELGLSASEEDQGKMFCDQGAQALAEALEKACRKAGCRFLCGRPVTGLIPPAGHEGAEPGGLYQVETEHGPLYAPRVVLALGSPAWPALGGTDIVARLAGNLGLTHVPARPALTPLVLSGAEAALCRELTGLSINATLSLGPDSACGGASFTDGLLFTHQGLSGPAALRLSSYWRRGEEITINLAPGVDMAALLRQSGRGKALARTILSEFMPRRLAEARLKALPQGMAANVPDKRLAELSRAEMDALTQVVCHWRVTPKATAGMARAEAASGGLDTDAFSAKTMQCKALPGLFAVGEALDVAGDLGGFNLHWAWASGFAAGQAL
ncbi:MAG TPA: aminoacetone oxidase family FAD-binding enzyme [Humidesulfovibrio sp.]|uniref:NAD(P)/FAD-dependent oxidoreductase n=1 Tax=Humidesulfovibrio sp. TaxID=2910988 RepID=UPI002CB8151D|nr:aminoacetone oxidase family FAD-binding enzyme [Humidesulfovibrio sp.]HWR02705.1 aminoacetone oxidase family FAD-binding enzyme [Humidesulfovibrio sp.]